MIKKRILLIINILLYKEKSIIVINNFIKSLNDISTFKDIFINLEIFITKKNRTIDTTILKNINNLDDFNNLKIKLFYLENKLDEVQMIKILN